MNMFKKALTLAFSVILFSGFLTRLSFEIDSSATSLEYHSEQNSITEIVDTTFHWGKTLLQGSWNSFRLWDDGWTTHCYISFKYGVDVSMDVPATLKLTYPNRLEPGETFTAKTTLEISGTRIIKIEPEIYLAIDLDLPLPIYIPNVGWREEINAIYGGDWTITFNLNQKTVKQVMDRIWIGDFDSGKYYAESLELGNYVVVKDLFINSATLGELASAEIRLDFLKAIFEIAEDLSLVVPPVSALIHILDWLVTEVLGLSTGLIISPKISAFVESPVFTYSKDASVDTNVIRFDNEMSAKTMPLTVDSKAREKSEGNEFIVYLSPVSFVYSFDADWQYYIDVNIDFLNVDIYENEWLFDLFSFPSIERDSEAVKQSVSFSTRIDEPLKATFPRIDGEEISIQLSDNSGVLESVVHYSTDRSYWKEALMSRVGETYSATPIKEVSKETKIYYIVKAKDGDGDSYTIDDKRNYFYYTLKPQPKPPLILAPLLTSPTNLWLIVAVVIAVSATIGLIVWKKHTRSMHAWGFSVAPVLYLQCLV